MNVTTLVAAIVAQAIPKSMWPNADILWPGNWPVDAVYGIAYKSNHRDFGNRESGWSTVYFKSIEEYRDWLSEEQLHIRNIDYAYSVTGKLYEWDWGPVFKEGFNLG